MKKLLIIRFSALGDVALLVPVVRALATQNPDLQITLLSQQRMADLFADLPANVHFLGVDLKKQSLRTIVSELGHYDLVADMHSVWRSWYIDLHMWLRGAKIALIHKGRWSKWLLTHGFIHRPLTSTPQRYQNVINSLHGPIMDLQWTNNGPITTRQKCGIAPFAAHPGKIYPLERMEQVVRLLSEQGEQVVLFGGKEDANVLDAWAKKYQNVTSVAGKYALREELERMRSLRVMVSMDSANMHLASLVGTRVVSIWGATHPNLGFLGYGQKTTDCVQRDLPCRPCSTYGKKKCKYGDYRCMDIAPEEIVARIKQTGQ